MDSTLICPKCQQPLTPDAYFCLNCGQVIKKKPLATNAQTQIFLYLKTLLLPPMGFYWGYKYLRQDDRTSKIVGWVTIVITFIELIWVVQSTITAVNTVNQTIQSQYGSLGL